jgi:hypothetical protein
MPTSPIDSLLDTLGNIIVNQLCKPTITQYKESIEENRKTYNAYREDHGKKLAKLLTDHSITWDKPTIREFTSSSKTTIANTDNPAPSPWAILDRLTNLITTTNTKQKQDLDKWEAAITELTEKNDAFNAIHDAVEQSFSDPYFLSTIQQLLARPHSQYHEPHWEYMQLVHHLWWDNSSPLSDIPTTKSQYMPHPVIVDWLLQKISNLPAKHGVPLAKIPNLPAKHGVPLAWIAQKLADDTNMYRALKFFYDQKQYLGYTVVIGISHPELKRQDIDTALFTSKIFFPNHTAGTNNPRKFGNITYDQYTFAYACIANEYSQDKGLPNEDVLLFDYNQSHKAFFIVVCDGVSQSCFSNLAATSVAQMLHRGWSMALEDTEPDIGAVPKHIYAALYAAKYDTADSVVKKLTDTKETQSLSAMMQKVLTDVYYESGSQSTFACVFSIGTVLYWAWMGNTTIVVQGNHDKTILGYDRFSSDSARFSSHSARGTRGTLNIERFDSFLTDNDTWRIIVHSDALEEYEDRQKNLYEQEFRRPTNRPLNIDDAKLYPCIKRDDTTIIELFYSKDNSSNS